MQPPSINSSVSALRFFFTVTLDRPDLARRLTVVRQPRRLPAVLSVEEITLLLQAAPGPKYKAAFATAYGAGLRVSEVVALKVGDIDSERMLLRVEQGKGRKDRDAMLSPQLLELLRDWWVEGRRRGVLLPRGWLFPGHNPIEPLSTRQLNRAVHAAAEAGFVAEAGEQRRHHHQRRHHRRCHHRRDDQPATGDAPRGGVVAAPSRARNFRRFIRPRRRRPLEVALSRLLISPPPRCILSGLHRRIA
jgi:integrase/recombinase XerD